MPYDGHSVPEERHYYSTPLDKSNSHMFETDLDHFHVKPLSLIYYPAQYSSLLGVFFHVS